MKGRVLEAVEFEKDVGVLVLPRQGHLLEAVQGVCPPTPGVCCFELVPIGHSKTRKC